MMVSPKRPRDRQPLESQDAKRPKIHDRDFHRRDTRAAAIQEAAQMKDWLSKEDDFVLKQAKKRAAIRVRESRAKPIDFLAVNLRFVDAERDPAEENELDEVEVQPRDPAVYLKSLHPQELDELYGDLEEFLKLESNRSNRHYWRALLLVCEDQKINKEKSHTNESRTLETVGIEVESILKDKSLQQLEGLEKSIKKKLDGDEAIDVDYWEQLHKAVKLKQAWGRLEHLFQLIRTAAEQESKRKEIVFRNGKRMIADVPARYKLDTEQTSEEPGKTVVRSNEQEFATAASRLYKKEAGHELEADEELFNKEADVVLKPPKWRLKCPDIVPIKPKYFNRAQTGFEWNSYNKIHYNDENPPPKVVWGYRFNIFYPELLDLSKAPTYRIERNLQKKGGANLGEEMCLIRFSAGAPYEDVSFEIEAKEWDHSSKYDRGFKSCFEKGILQLHFKFKKISYRK